MSHIVWLLQPPWESGRALLSPHLIAQPQNGLFCANPVRRHVLAHPADWTPGLSFPSWVTMVVVQSLSHLWLCDPMDYSPPGSSVHGSSQAGILEWVAISLHQGIFLIQGSNRVSCIAGDSSSPEPPEKPLDENKVKNTGGDWVDNIVKLRYSSSTESGQ